MMPFDEEMEDDDFDDESDGYYFEDDLHDDDPLDLLPCPHCGAEIYEEAPQCPACGNYVVHQSNVWMGRSLWWIVLGLLGIVAVILALSVGP